MKVYVVGEWLEVAVKEMFVRNGHKIVNNMKEADLVQFTGGSDISPELYSIKKHPSTSTNPTRDKIELIAFQRAREFNKPIAGICRGAQFLCVMDGGKLWQDVNNHIGDHKVKDTITDTFFTTNSYHHQMMIPSAHAEILAFANEATRKETVRDDGTISSIIISKKEYNQYSDPEVVWFDKINALGIQGHPEWGEKFKLDEIYINYIQNYLNFKTGS